MDKNEVYGRHHTSHLIHTAKILSDNGCNAATIVAGALHSLYDNDSMYGNKGANYNDRDTIRDIVGRDTEQLIFLYSQVHTVRDFTQISGNDEGVVIHTKSDDILLSDSELNCLADILLSDMIEQIVWCVDHKGIFTIEEAQEHLAKLVEVSKYATLSIRQLFDRYWEMSCAQA
ncbi:hypothetical protein SBX64_19780 [Vibrio rhizosphaerae]|uniref:DUF6817 domain-containing protein n=1 Tax=Vibrio rhizosphaerae TaxID=398736 RepID=A0ABU4J1S2_9VIBR|nr:hypothetical protein [Vibrio rhizosphaerae]MDW6094789.1 hypothetical protein [Vibrio rhizosphaerae]